jgi:hypothetical protein
MTISETKGISIVSFLHTLGVEPIAIHGKDWWYFAPYRKDSHPSLSVNTEINLWHDMIGFGGDLLELVKRIYSCNTSQALKKIEKTNMFPINPINYKSITSASGIEILKVKELQHPELLQYIKFRGISINIAKHFLSEVHYLAGQNRVEYKALGFGNDSYGWELRSPKAKVACKPKDITSFKRGYDRCILTEGFMDLLSYADHLEKKPADYLVLNSVTMINRAITKLKTYKYIYFFGDNDDAGNAVHTTLRNANLPIIDCRTYYSEYKDLNEKYQKSENE